MSPCSRGAIARALRLYVLRIQFRAYSRQLAPLYPRLCSTRTLSLINSLDVRQQPANPHRAFSTTRFRHSEAPIGNLIDVLPVCCPGCGAFSQVIDPDQPGYYSKSRKSRKQTRKPLSSKEDVTELQDSPIQDQAHSIDESTAPKPIQGKSLAYISRPLHDN
jgi:hypothetical protein